MANKPQGMQLQGAKELQKLMDAFGKDIAIKAGRKGVAKAAGVVKAEMKKASPDGSSWPARKGRKWKPLKSSWVFRVVKGQRGKPWIFYNVFPRGAPAFLDLLEWKGQDPSKRKRVGNSRRRRNWPRMKGETHPYATAAADRASRKALATMVSHAKTSIAFEAGRIHRLSQGIK